MSSSARSLGPVRAIVDLVSFLVVLFLVLIEVVFFEVVLFAVVFLFYVGWVRVMWSMDISRSMVPRSAAPSRVSSSRSSISSMETAWRVAVGVLVIENLFGELAGAGSETADSEARGERVGGQYSALVANGRGGFGDLHRGGMRRGVGRDLGGLGEHFAGGGDRGDVVRLSGGRVWLGGFGRGSIDGALWRYSLRGRLTR